MSNSNLLIPADSVAAATHDGKTHLLLAASGSVAVVKLPCIISALKRHRNLSIRIILTSFAARFFNGQASEQPTLATLASLPNVDAVYQDDDEFAESWTRGTGILHINLRKWAHILFVVPLSANSLAKIVNGICDSLLTNVIRAWDTTGLVDGEKKRIIVAPSMNTAMWLQPVTARQIRVLEEDWGVKESIEDINKDNVDSAVQGWFEVLRPIEKALACGDVGAGGMVEWTEIVKIIEQRLGLTT